MKLRSIFSSFYYKLSMKLEKHSINALRVALAIIFIWFGGLKLLGESPAQELVIQTVYYFPSEFFVPFLGAWEIAIGIGLLIKKWIPFTIILLLLHMAGTFLPFLILPETCFVKFPFCPSLEGQYILKNLVIISGALTVGGKYNLEYYRNKLVK